MALNANPAPAPAYAVARASVVGLVAYWFVYCLVSAANVTDAQVYNQARLYVIAQGGLFHNRVHHSMVQIAYPWTFDAIHWPFLRAGFGHALPAFACLLGTLLIVHRIADEEYGADCAWLCCLAILAMPAVVYQGTSTKNDFPVVFGICCWYYALRRYRRAGRTRYLVASALATAFSGGVKSSGLVFVPLLATASVWCLRRHVRDWLVWLGSMLVASLLLLSVETYVASRLTFGDWLGPNFRAYRNRDGVGGTIANAVRFAFLNVDVGADAILGRKSALSALMERCCQAVLAPLGIAWRGWMDIYRAPALDFTKSGHEASAGYGPFGTLSLLLVPLALLLRRPRAWAWRLAAAALVTFVLLSATIGWERYNNRRLVVPFVLAALSSTLLLEPAWRVSRGVRAVLLGILLFGAVALPLGTSSNRKPRDLWLWVTDRDRITMRENPSLIPVLRTIRRDAAACPDAVWLVSATGYAWELVFYDVLGDRAHIVAGITPASLAEVASRYPDRTIHALTLGHGIAPTRGLEELRAFPVRTMDGSRTWTRLYRFGPNRCPTAGKRRPAS